MTPDIRLLGPLEIDFDGVPLGLGGPRSERLMAALLLSPNTTLTFDRLVDVLWDVPPSSARQQVHTTVNRLRSRLAVIPDIHVVTTQAGYRCDIDPGRIDVVRFRALVAKAVQQLSAGEPAEAVESARDACDLWRGPALASMDGQYFLNVGLRLEEERLAALELLLDLRVRTGEGAHVIGELTALVESHPLRESPRASLMTALHEGGRAADALAVYEKGRRLLSEEFGLDPSSHLQQLQERILRSMPVQGGERPKSPRPPTVAPDRHSAPSAPSGSRPGKRFLPHDTNDFCGRLDEFTQLMQAGRQARSSALVISAINGMGGIGKTTLAVHFANFLSEEYPDGQYFVDLRGFTTGREPLAPEEALDVLLQQHGVPAELVPVDLDARSAAWRAEMAGKTALVLLDNAVDAEQIRPLLPGGSGPLVVITSRRRLVTLEGASAVYLGPMTLDDASVLFVRIAGAERAGADPQKVRAIVELCGRLPLAIRIAAARFRDRSSWTLQYLARLLEIPEQRVPLLQSGETSVAAVLALSHQHLSPDQGRFFRLLSVLPGQDFDPRTAAVIADVTEEQALTVLESLFDDNLILQDKPGRYSLHDLLRDCAVQLCAEYDSEQDIQRAYSRLVEYSIWNASEWCKPIARGPFRRENDVAHPRSVTVRATSTAECHELLAEHGNGLIEIARSALKQSSPDLAWRMVCAIQPLLRDRNYPGDSFELFDGAAVLAQRAGDRAGEALCLLGKALVLRERFQIEAACRALDAALALSRSLRDRSAEMYQLNELGVTLVHGARYTEARDYFIQAQATSRDVGDERLSATLSGNLAVVCQALGLFQEGFDHLADALRAHRALDQPLAVARDTLNVGVMFLRDKQPAEAVEHLTEAMRLEELHRGSPGYVSAASLAALADAERALGKTSDAFGTGRAALLMARERHILDVECEALNVLGETHLAIGDLAPATTSFIHAANLARKHRLTMLEARAYEGLAHVALRQGHESQARRHFQDAVDRYPPDVADVQSALVHLADPKLFEVDCAHCVSPGR